MRRSTRSALIEREAEAFRLYLSGCTFQQIATELGYANRSSAWRMVHRSAASRVRDSSELTRALTEARLDAIICANWAKMEAGDPQAGMLVLRANHERARLQGILS